MDDVKDFVTQADRITRTIINALSIRLGLPEGSMLAKHDGHSPSEARTIMKPPVDLSDAAKLKQNAIGAHSDFGSLSFLFNRGM